MLVTPSVESRTRGSPHRGAVAAICAAPVLATLALGLIVFLRWANPVVTTDGFLILAGLESALPGLALLAHAVAFPVFLAYTGRSFWRSRRLELWLLPAALYFTILVAFLVLFTEGSSLGPAILAL